MRLSAPGAETSANPFTEETVLPASERNEEEKTGCGCGGGSGADVFPAVFLAAGALTIRGKKKGKKKSSKQ